MVFDRVLTDAEISGDVLAGVAREGARASMVKTGARMTCSTGSRCQRCNSFILRLKVLQKRQPPVTPRDPIGVAATH
jgi:hypothetical protein